MTTGRVGQQAPSSSSAYNDSDLNPYRYSAKSNHGLPHQINDLNGSTSTLEGIIELQTEDELNNILSNETVIIYKYGGGGGASSNGTGMQRPDITSTTDWERERVRMEFYATYDVMTGVRIAGTLAAFFGLMVMLVMYKSRTNTMRALKDPSLATKAAEMVQEEEDRELQEAFDTLEAAGIFPELESLPYRDRRLLSLGNISAPPTLNYSPRFSSVGGGSCSLWDPPTRPSPNYKFMQSRSVSSEHQYRPLPLDLGHSRREAFRNSRNSSSDRSQCVSFDMSESTVRSAAGHHRRRSDTRAWMGRRATFQSIQSDSLKSRNKIFLSNTRQGREANRIKLIRLYTTSSSREEDVEEVIEQGGLPLATRRGDGQQQEEALQQEIQTAAQQRRQQSTSTTSFIVSSVDYQDSDLRSVGSESVFSEPYVDTEEDEDERDRDEGECSSSESEDDVEVLRLRTGAYQKMKPKTTATARIDDCTIATYEMPSGSKAPQRTVAGGRPKSLYETRTFELHSIAPSPSLGSSRIINIVDAVGGENRTSSEMVQLRGGEQTLAEQQQICLPGTSTKWSKETLF